MWISCLIWIHFMIKIQNFKSQVVILRFLRKMKVNHNFNQFNMHLMDSWVNLTPKNKSYLQQHQNIWVNSYLSIRNNLFKSKSGNQDLTNNNFKDHHHQDSNVPNLLLLHPFINNKCTNNVIKCRDNRCLPCQCNGTTLINIQV